MKRERRPIFDILKEEHHPLVADRQRLNDIAQKLGLCALLDALFQIITFMKSIVPLSSGPTVTCFARKRNNTAPSIPIR